MKRLSICIFLITISIALISVCAVSAADADNIDLGDSGFDSGFLLMDNSIQSSPQELGNKNVDTTKIDGNYIKNMEDTPASTIKYDDTRKAFEEIIAPYMHNNTKDSGFRSDSGLLKMDYSIQSSTQELGNKNIDIIKYDSKYINPEDRPIISTDYYDTLKSIEESLAPYMHNNTKDSGFRSDSGLLRTNMTTTNHDSDAMNSTSDDNIFNMFINQKPYDKILPTNHDLGPDSRYKIIPNEKKIDLNNKTSITKILEALKNISIDDYKKMPSSDNLPAYNSLEEMFAALGQQSSSNQ